MLWIYAIIYNIIIILLKSDEIKVLMIRWWEAGAHLIACQCVIVWVTTTTRTTPLHLCLYSFYF